jgi:hypothetical protein
MVHTVVSVRTEVGTAVAGAKGMSIRVPIVGTAGMKPSYCPTSESGATATSESHGTATSESHATATTESHAATPESDATASMTTALGKGILWGRAECDTRGDCGEKNFQQKGLLH